MPVNSYLICNIFFFKPESLNLNLQKLNLDFLQIPSGGVHGKISCPCPNTYRPTCNCLLIHYSKTMERGGLFGFVNGGLLLFDTGLIKEAGPLFRFF